MRNWFRSSLALSALALACLLAGCHSENTAVPSAASKTPAAASPSTTATKPLLGKPSTAPSHRTAEAVSKSVAPRTSYPVANPMLVSYRPTPKLFEQGVKTPVTKVALTFDCCYSDVGVPLILQSLAEHHLHCTFFMAGYFSNHFAPAARQIADAGMEIGNHSYSHPAFTKLSDDKVRDQLNQAEGSIEKACGRGAKPLFRFPYGDNDRRTRQLVVEEGYQPIQWTLDSLDSVGKPKSADFVVNRIESKIKPGSITLMHVSCLESAKALPRILDYLEKNGYQVVTVGELLLDQQAANAQAKPTPKAAPIHALP